MRPILVFPPVHGHEESDGTLVQLIKQMVSLEGLLPGEIQHLSLFLDPAAGYHIGAFDRFVEPLRIVAPAPTQAS
jgi:hypothetical protein